MRKQQRLPGSQMRRDLFRINSRHCTVWKRKKNNISALRGSGCVQTFETATPGMATRFAIRVEPDKSRYP
jgi:hypothetical protein